MKLREFIAFVAFAAILTTVNARKESNPNVEDDFDIKSAQIDYGKPTLVLITISIVSKICLNLVNRTVFRKLKINMQLELKNFFYKSE